jgi:hypothetical protein
MMWCWCCSSALDIALIGVVEQVSMRYQANLKGGRKKGDKERGIMEAGRSYTVRTQSADWTPAVQLNSLCVSDVTSELRVMDHSKGFHRAVSDKVSGARGKIEECGRVRSSESRRRVSDIRWTCTYTHLARYCLKLC